MGKFSIELHMETLVCFECGIMYAAPSQWARNKMQDDEGQIHCPNGHQNRYDWGEAPDQEKEDNAALKRQMDELRRRNFQLMHEREQAEARASEGRAMHADATEPDAVDAITEGGTDAAEGHAIGKGDDGKWKCPACEKAYGGKAALIQHLRSQHFMERREDGSWSPKPVPEMPEEGYEIGEPRSISGRTCLACPVCAKRYLGLDGRSLWYHLRSKHDLECYNGRWFPKGKINEIVAWVTGGGKR